MACLCPLARTVWNRFYWKSLLKFQGGGEYWSLVRNGYQTAESSREGSKQTDMSVTIHFFYQFGCWFNILQKALNASPFTASVQLQWRQQCGTAPGAVGWQASRRPAHPEAAGGAVAFPLHPARAHQLSQLSKALLNFLNMCHIKIQFWTAMCWGAPCLQCIIHS